MIETRIEETTSNPSLGMKKVHKSTLSVSGSTSTTLVANSTYMIHFSLDIPVNNYDSLYKIKLRFRQSNANNVDAYLYDSTDAYITTGWYERFDYRQIGSVVYREIDLTKYFAQCAGQTKYFSIKCDSELSLYTDSASTGYKPELVVEKIQANDLLKHQVVLDGGIGDDQYKVNIRSGKLFYNKYLLGIKTTKSEISLGISYNIENRKMTTLGISINTGLGKGFKFNYQQYVYASGSNYIYIDADYIYHTYTLANNLSTTSSTKVYYDVSGNYSVLEILSNGYRITSGNKVLTFNSTGLLTQISIQTHENTTYVETITYDPSNRISTVTSGSSSLGFTYNSGNVVITSSDNRKVTIYIDSNTLISSITNVNGINTGYNYEEVGMLARAAIDMKQYFLNTITEGKKKVVFTYTENNKVLTATNYYNSNKVQVDKIEYLGKQNIVTNTQCINGIAYEGLAIKKAYNFSKLGYLESSFEIVDEKVCDVKYYTYKVDEDEVITLSTGNEYYSTSDISLRPTQTQYVTDLQHFTSGEHILSVACRFKKTGAYDTAKSYSIIARAKVDGQTQGEIQFDYDGPEYQVGYVKLNLDWDAEDPNLDSEVVVTLENSLENHNVEFMSVCLSAKQANNVKTCVNISNGTVVTNYDNNDLYKNQIYKFSCNTSSLSSIKMSFNDIVENQRLLSLGTTHNLWYNDGENMYYGVSNVSLYNGNGNTKTLGAVLNAKVSKFLVPKDADTKVNFETINLIKYVSTNTKQITENRYQDYENSNTSQTTTYDRYFKVITEQENNIIKTYNYDSNGNVSSIVTTANNKSMNESYSYNSDGDVTGVSNNGVTTNYAYNNLRNVTSVSRSGETLKTISYKADLEAISSVKATVGSTQLTNTFNYNSYLEPTGYTGSEGTYTYEYDTYGQLSGVKLDGTTILSYQYSVSSPNVIVQVTNRAGEVTKQTLDKYGRTISITEGSTVVSTFEYIDQQGLVSSEARLRSKKINSGSTNSVVYTYDYNGKLNKVEDNVNNVEYTKNSFVTLSQGNDNTNIDQVLNVSVNNINDGNVTLNEQVIGCLLEDNKNAQSTYSTTYSKNGSVKIFTEQINQDDLKRINSEYINNFLRTFEYKINGSYTTPFVSKETFKKGNIVLGEASYGYTNGLITSITKDGYTITYQYDKLNRIISEYNPKLGIDKTFTYDEKGNLSITDIRMSYSGQKLTKYDDKTLTYDSYDRLCKYGDINIAFEKDRLISYNNISFSYDGEGKRIQKYSSSKTHRYYYDGKRLFKESITEGDTTKDIYYINGAKGVIGFIYDDVEYYYNRNILGDVVSILNSNEVIVASYEYDAWGNHNVYDTNGALDTSATSIGNINPIRYRGYYYDKETELYYCNYRYYKPEWGRWISPDSVDYLQPENINGLNLYAYCMNNPICLTCVDFENDNNFSNILNNDDNSTSQSEQYYFNDSSNIPWTILLGSLFSVKSGLPILSHYIKNAKIIKYEFQIYGISKWKTANLLSNVNWGMTGLDIGLIFAKTAIDMVDSYKRGVSMEGIFMGGAYTLACGVAMFYMNKGIMWAATTIGTAICPGVGTAIGFGIGLLLSCVANASFALYTQKWIDENIK